jgi:hypothetical protein
MQRCRGRDLRLDLFRGLPLLIIFVAHVRGNSWTGVVTPTWIGVARGLEGALNLMHRWRLATSGTRRL